MTHPEGAPGAGGVEPDYHELVYGLEHPHLAHLSGVLKGRWGTVIRTERIRREQALDDMRNYQPAEVDMPTYEGVQDYFVQARAINHNPPPASDHAKIRPAIKTVQSIAHNYLDQSSSLTRLSGNISRMDADDLKVFFGSNLYGVVGTARAVAQRSLEVQRSAILRRHFPGINLMNRAHLESSVREMPIIGAQVEAAQEEIIKLPPGRAPYPDFFHLQKNQQTEIMEALAGEWEELCLIVHQANPKLLVSHATHLTAPLAYLPVSELKEAITNNPSVNPAKISYAFLHAPTEFAAQVSRLRAQAGAAATLMGATVQWQESSKKAPETVEFLRYDHALITVGDQNFYLPIDQPLSQLAARVLAALEQAGSQPFVGGRALAKAIWNEIPPTERHMFTTRARDLERKSGVIDAAVLDILRRLTSRMGITRETSGERFQIEQRSSVSLERVPPSEGVLGLIPIFPPNTLREKIYEFQGDTIPNESLATATDILKDFVYGDAPLSQSYALDLLGFVMTRNGKRALRARLEASGTDLTLESTLDYLDDKIKSVLSEGYDGARQNRVIAGNHATGQHKVKHISGDLPIITRQNLSSTIKRWYVGDSRF